MSLDQVTLLYQISPIFLTGGIASNISGGVLPLLSLTNSDAFSSDLLGGNENFALDDAFAVFQPAVGGSLIEQAIATYPFANLYIAANAIIKQPINLSMIMFIPMRQNGSWSKKLATMTALKTTLDNHNNSGGTYTICTPAVTYYDMLMVNLIDVSTERSPIPQNAWRFDFVKPLVSESDAQGAMSNLMSQISSGAAPLGGGNVPGSNDVTDPVTALGSPFSSIANTGPNAGATSAFVSQTPLNISSSYATFNNITWQPNVVQNNGDIPITPQINNQIIGGAPPPTMNSFLTIGVPF